MAGPALRRALPVAVGVVTLACFLPAVGNDFVLWDDDLNITENPHYRGLGWRQVRWMFTTVHGGHYQPLSWLTLGLDHVLWGLHPAGYHLTSVVLHAATAVLVYALIGALLGEVAPGLGAGRRAGAAAVGALLFALHPLRVESVAWVSERRDVVAGLFYVGAVWAYVRRAAAERAGVGAAGWYALSLGCFVLSLLGKAWGMTLPVVLVLLDRYPLGRGGRWGEKVPYVVVAGAGAALAFGAQAQVPAMRTLAEHGVLARGAQAAYGLCFYLVKTLVPWHLSPAYVLEAHLDWTAPRYLGALVAVVGITGVCGALWRRAPWALVAWGSYAVIVSPVLGFVQTGPQLVADRYTYLACLPWAVVGAGAVAAGSGGRWVRAVWAGAAAVLVVLAALTVRQLGVWKDSMTLWNYTLGIDPTNYIAYTNRGVARQAAGDLDGALADYGAALRFNPGDPQAANDRGIIRFLRGDLDGALADYSAAIRVRPTYADAYENRGIAREARGDLEGAMADYSEAIRQNSGYAKAYYSRGNLWAARGNADAAIADYTAAIAAAPGYVEAYNNRASSRRAKGDVEGAVADYVRALEVAPPGTPGLEMIRQNLAAARAAATRR